MCVLGCERDLWEGCLGVRMSEEVCLWTCVLMSGGTCMIKCQSYHLEMECAGSGGRCLGSGVWVGLGVVYLGVGICVEL